MPLALGTRLGPYEILAPIGEGGEVYRASDPRMGRDVAIKISMEQFSERFSREIRAVAALNHANICHLYDVGPNYLVMELIEGPTLAERIKEGPVPLEEALGIAKQIADALEAAHEKGIVHRDLKPANIKVKPDGTVKVLDFGLAKIADQPESSGRPEQSPTLTLDAATRVGVVLGTAAYMPPEQARGKKVDKRADIWAFGVVLYEMLTGERLFEGETVSDTLIEVATKEPDWGRIPAVPGKNVQRLLRRCLTKDPKRRLRDIGEAWFLLEDGGEHPGASPAAVAPAPRHRRLPWIVATAVTTVAALALIPGNIIHFRENPPAPELVRFQIPLPESVAAQYSLQVSPDGRKLAFVGISSGVAQVWVRTLDSLEMRPLAGTEGITATPFWSFDSRSIALPIAAKLKKVDVTGGPPQTICDTCAAVGGFWTREGAIVFGGAGGQGLMRVPATGGAPTPLTLVDPTRSEDRHLFPVLLPDGRHFLYLRYSTVPANSGIYTGSLDAKPEEQSLRRVLATQFVAQYVPSADPKYGFLLFFRDGTLFAQSFDTQRLELTRDPTPLADQVGNYANAGLFSASSNGVLIYSTRRPEQLQLSWFNRQGKVVSTLGELGSYRDVSISPDGARVAVAQSGFNTDLWLIDSARGIGTRFTVDPAPDAYPVWSPDGSQIVFFSLRGGRPGLYRKASNGARSEQLLFESPEPKIAMDWSHDGRYVFFGSRSPKTQYDIWALPMKGDRKPFLVTGTQFDEQQGRFSPDSRWVAYSSDASGRREIYVQPFGAASSADSSAAGGAVRVSTNGGTRPRWRRDGMELFYVAGDGKMILVGMNAGHAGLTSTLFQAPAGFTDWDVSADGSRFLFAVPIAGSARTPFTVVLNWQAGLKKPGSF